MAVDAVMKAMLAKPSSDADGEGDGRGWGRRPGATMATPKASGAS